MLAGHVKGGDKRGMSLSSMFEAVGKHAAGTMDDAEFLEWENSACPSCGSCSGMYTANSMNCLTEAIGMGLPGNGTVPAVYSERLRLAKEAGYQVMERRILPDEPELLKQELMRLCDQKQVNLIVTSGGTGFSLRDQTPEATLAVADRNAPGIAEAIRAESMKYTKHAMLSRGVSVLRKQTLIVNLPGSPRAVRESMEVFLPGVEHGLRLLQGTDGECGRSLGK